MYAITFAMVALSCRRLSRSAVGTADGVRTHRNRPQMDYRAPRSRFAEWPPEALSRSGAPNSRPYAALAPAGSRTHRSAASRPKRQSPGGRLPRPHWLDGEAGGQHEDGPLLAHGTG